MNKNLRLVTCAFHLLSIFHVSRFSHLCHAILLSVCKWRLLNGALTAAAVADFAQMLGA